MSHWEHFDLDRRCWFIPAGHSRSRNPRIVPLTDDAIEALREMQVVADAASPCVFHALKGAPCPPQVFAAQMQALGLLCRNFSELRNLAIDRVRLRGKNLTLAQIHQVIGKPLPSKRS